MTCITMADLRPRPWLLLAFLLCYTGTAAFFQLKSDIPPHVDGSPVEFFTSALLWVLSIMALLIADRHWGASPARACFWLLASAGLGVVALDEIFGYHERTRFAVGDDDHLKLAAMLASAGAVCLVARWERRPAANALLAVGLVFQTLYGLVDFGDGDYFRLPLLSLASLQWLEELFELLTLEAYAAAFIYLHAALAESPARAGLSAARAARQGAAPRTSAVDEGSSEMPGQRNGARGGRPGLAGRPG